MKTNSTYKELMDIDMDVRRLMSSPAFVVFNRQKIKNFQQSNAIRLKLLANTVNELMETHIKKNDKGEFQQKIKVEGQPNSWDFLSEADGENFRLRLDDFLSKSIEIII